MSAPTRQLRLALPKPRTHGGARKGAGRKPKGDRAGVSHGTRDEVTADTPVHVSLRLLPHVWNLRTRASLAAISGALGGMLGWTDFRVVHFSLAGNHLHLLVEADHNRALSEGMQGLKVRLARALNRMMERRGPVFADRYHAHVLRTPAEGRNALAYVLLNHRGHMLRIGEREQAGTLERYSSAVCFDGWIDGPPPEPPTITSAPRSWLLRTGWRRRGLLSRSERPGVPLQRPGRPHAPTKSERIAAPARFH